MDTMVQAVTLTLAEAAMVLDPPVTEQQLRAVVSALGWQPCGWRRTGRAGRPVAAFDATRLLELHAAMVPFLGDNRLLFGLRPHALNRLGSQSYRHHGGLTVTETEVHCAAAPGHRWRIGRYQVEYDHGKWGISDGCKGVGNYKSPIGAWLALRRWQRTPSRPVE